MEQITISIANPLMFDRLYTLSLEYSLPMELLINVAIKRLIDDVAFVRNLRVGKVKLELE